MKIKLFTIPNILTLCNLLSGCAAAVFALCVNDLQWAFWCVVVAAVFDFLDGFVARLLKSHSAIGKELDSLADMVSFGFAPAAVLYTMYAMTGGSDVWGFAVFVVAGFFGPASGEVQPGRESDHPVHRPADARPAPCFSCRPAI